MRNDVPITIVGNLTADPELRFTPGGEAVCKFTVAHNVRLLDKSSGEWKDGEPSFHNCTAWRQLGENVAETLGKGHRVIVTGSLRQRSWKDPKTDEPRWSWEVTVDAVGPDLSYATATVKKMARGRDQAPPDDPWATASRTAPVPAGVGASDEPPF